MRRVNGWPLDCHGDPLNLSRSQSLAGLISPPKEALDTFHAPDISEVFWRSTAGQ